MRAASADAESYMGVDGGSAVGYLAVVCICEVWWLQVCLIATPQPHSPTTNQRRHAGLARIFASEWMPTPSLHSAAHCGSAFIAQYAGEQVGV